jgi:hypothetical protein
MTEPDDLSSAGEDTPGEDDGVLSFSDSLLSDDLDADVLDTGVDAGSGYRGATAYGTTAAEEARGESLADHLAEEEPDQQPDLPWTDEDEPTDDGNVALPRSGRLVAADEGAHGDDEADLVAFDADVDGGGASAEEAAVHLTRPPDYT